MESSPSVEQPYILSLTQRVHAVYQSSFFEDILQKISDRRVKSIIARDPDYADYVRKTGAYIVKRIFEIPSKVESLLNIFSWQTKISKPELDFLVRAVFLSETNNSLDFLEKNPLALSSFISVHKLIILGYQDIFLPLGDTNYRLVLVMLENTFRIYIFLDDGSSVIPVYLTEKKTSPPDVVEVISSLKYLAETRLKRVVSGVTNGLLNS